MTEGQLKHTKKMKQSPEKILDELKELRLSPFPFKEIALMEALETDPQKLCRTICDEIDLVASPDRGTLSRLLGLARIDSGLWLYQMPYYAQIRRCITGPFTEIEISRQLNQIKCNIISDFSNIN